jgi:hypothetical protein
MIGKYGKVTLLNDPEQQRKMLANRKISGVYRWTDGGETTYTGSYELSFLEFLDQIMNYNSSDIIAPSPHTYYYEYEGEKHFYIPDFFIPSLNLEIEIKDGGDNSNMHPKIQAVDKVKENLKDQVMKSNSKNFNYLKIVNKDNKRFFKYLEIAKKQFFEGIEKPIFMTESTSSYGLSSSFVYLDEDVFNESEDLFMERNDEIVNDGGILSNFDQNEIRKIDILNKQLKTGKISKEEFNTKINEIKKDCRSEFELPEKGSKAFFDPNKGTARENSVKPTTDLSSIRKGGGNNIRIDGTVDDVIFKNLQRHLNICRTTENYSEYKQHHSQICKMCGVPKDSSIAPSPRLDISSHKVCIRFYTEKNKAEIPVGSKLFHTSKQNGITRLQGKWKSSDGVLYSSMRVYFYIGKPGSRIGSTVSENEHIYMYKGSTDNAYIDPELHGNAIYIETNTSVPVTKIKNNEKDVKESFNNLLDLL